jgi:cytoskeleton protein RodZ
MTTSLHEPAAAEVGRLLREARLARGEEIAVAAEELRIRPTHLEALEEGRLGRLLAPVYVVGQTRAYAKHLGLDGAELARRLKMPGGRGGAPGVERSEPAVGRWRAAASLAGLLLLGVGAYVGCRAGFRTGPGTMPAPSSSAAPTSTPVAPVADPGGPTASLPDGPREAAASPTSPVTVGPQAAEPPSEPQRAPIADLSPSPAQSTLAGAAAAPAPVQAANAPPLPAALSARDDDAGTGEVPPAVGIGGPAPPTPPSLPVDTATAGPADAAAVASATPVSSSPGAPQAAAPRAEEAGPAETHGRFAIHVASVRDPAGVTAEWQRLVRLHPTLAGLEPQPAKVAEIPGKGRFYRVLGGAFATRAEAQAACARLQAEGSDCRPVPL